MDPNHTIETPTPVPSSTQSSSPSSMPPSISKPSVELKNPTKVHKNRTGLFIVLGVIAVLTALIAAAFWYLNNNQKQITPQTATTVTTKPSVVAQPTPEDFSKEVNGLTVEDVDTSDVDKDLDKLK